MSESTLQPAPRPLPPEVPLPHRKTIRGWLLPLVQRTTLRPVLLLVLDYVFFFALAAAAVLLEAGWARALAGLACGFVIGRLFIIGHDACHQSLTPHRRLNKWLGRIAFLPSLTPYSLWDMGHNTVHHGFTNLKGVDFVWAPLTQAEYVKMLYGLQKSPATRADIVEALRKRGIDFALTDGIRGLTRSKSANDEEIRRALEEADRRRQNPAGSVLP